MYVTFSTNEVIKFYTYFIEFLVKRNIISINLTDILFKGC